MSLSRFEEATPAAEQVVVRHVRARPFERRRRPELRQSVGDLKTHRADLLNQLGGLRAEDGLKILQEITRVDQDIWRLVKGARLGGRLS